MTVRWSPFTKGVVVVALLLLAVWLAGKFAELLAPLAITFLVAYILNLPVNQLVRRSGMSRTLATVIVFLITLIALGLLIAMISPRLVGLVASFQIDLHAVQDVLLQFAGQPLEIFDLEINPQTLLDQALATLTNVLSPVAASVLALVAGAAQAVGWALFIAVVSFLLVKDLNGIASAFGRRIPDVLQNEAYHLGRELNAIWNAFLRGRLILSIVIGVVITIALWIVGLPNSAAMGVITGVLAFIPSIGSVLAGVIAALVALARGSSWLPISNFWFAVLVTGLYVAIFQLESLYLLPRIVGRRVRLHPVVVIVGTLAGALAAGILGILLAAPVIASARVLLGYAFNKLLDQDPFPQVEEEPHGTHWRGQLRGRPVAAVLFDLDGTLVETDDDAVAVLAASLSRFRLLLPQGDVERAARHLAGWANDQLNWWLAVLDRVKLDGPAQRLARRFGLIQQNSQNRALTPVAGTVDLVRRLENRYRLGIVSTRTVEEVRVYLDQQGLNAQFAVIVGSDSTERIKPHPQPILCAASQLAVPPEHVIMVGDTKADVRAAKAAGALAVGVLCGFGDAADLDQADLVLTSTAELAEWLSPAL